MQNSTCNKGIFRETPQQLPKLEETHLHVDKICNPKNCLPFLCFKMLYSIYGNDMEIIVVLVFITNKNCNILSTHFTFTSCMARPCQSNGNRKHWNQKTEIKREKRKQENMKEKTVVPIWQGCSRGTGRCQCYGCEALSHRYYIPQEFLLPPHIALQAPDETVCIKIFGHN